MQPNSLAPRYGHVVGVVHALDGTLRPGCTVVPTSADEPAQYVPELAVFSDQQGRYSWNLRPGRYSVQALYYSSADSSTVLGSPAEVVIKSDQTATLDLTVP
ncbi:carboxypeptidase-like regulatory domain-containing protein [Saccharopolyspora indica]|uniref:hypothetical protein n=1 Tax=Saccharopolyspora indica TaxID=1229659 RepID=UPI0022EB5E4A|nr:hypothetical protein [Saccharopolyspora indica]MDA3643021.1 hypothetical protein [Saccharopolyspora indica]